MSKELEAWVLQPDDIKENLAQKQFSFKRSPKRVKARDVAWVLDKLAVTEDAGVPVFRAIGMLAEMRKKDAIGPILADIQTLMSEGSSLSSAMRKYEKEFTVLVCGLVDAGEAMGDLETALRRASDLVSSRDRLNRKVRAGLIYPVSVLVIVIAVVTALMIFIVPKFAEIYSSLDSELPAMTLLLVKASEYAPMFALLLLVLVAAGLLTLRASRTNIPLRRVLDAWVLKIPLIGSLVRKGINARIASTMASLIGAGVGLLPTLDYASNVANNLIYSDALNEVRRKISDGTSLPNALASAPEGIFPPLLIQLTEIGENSGSLPELMDKYATDAENEVALTADALTRLIEPLMIVVIAVIAGFFVIGLYLPMIQLGNEIK